MNQTLLLRFHKEEEDCAIQLLNILNNIILVFSFPSFFPSFFLSFTFFSFSSSPSSFLFVCLLCDCLFEEFLSGTFEDYETVLCRTSIQELFLSILILYLFLFCVCRLLFKENSCQLNEVVFYIETCAEIQFQE